MSEEGKGNASMAGRMFDGKQLNQAVLPIPKEIKTAELVPSSVVTAPTEEEGSLCTALAPSLDGQLSALAIKENRALAPEEMLRSYTFTNTDIDAFQQNYFTEQAELSADTTCHSIHKDTQEITKTQKRMEKDVTRTQQDNRELSKLLKVIANSSDMVKAKHMLEKMERLEKQVAWQQKELDKYRKASSKTLGIASEKVDPRVKASMQKHVDLQSKENKENGVKMNRKGVNKSGRMAT